MKCASNTNIFTQVFNEHAEYSTVPEMCRPAPRGSCCCDLELQITDAVLARCFSLYKEPRLHRGVAREKPDPQQTQNTTKGGGTFHKQNCEQQLCVHLDG